MRSTGHASIVHLDSDAALLATAHGVFHPETYRGCDAVITWGQVSGQYDAYIHPRGLDAYWAGTARLNLPVLESYVDAIQAFYSDPRLRRIQVEKQLSLPTYNDMTSWCLFTILHGGGHLPVPPSLLSELRASSIAWQMTNQHRVCNTQPHNFDRLPGHGIVQSASAEINPDIIQRVVTQGQKPKFSSPGLSTCSASVTFGTTISSIELRRCTIAIARPTIHTGCLRCTARPSLIGTRMLSCRQLEVWRPPCYSSERNDLSDPCGGVRSRSGSPSIQGPWHTCFPRSTKCVPAAG